MTILWTNSFTSMPTGQLSVQVGLAHSRHRSASCCASSALNPKFTSSKLCARASADCSGIACRGIFMRSLGDTGFFDLLPVGLIVVLLAAPPQLPHTPHQ